MNILVVGAGGREHALAYKLAQSPLAKTVYVAPGNAGTAVEEKIENVDVGAEDLLGLLSFAKDKRVDLTVVGPEQPLVDGIVDLFEAEGLAIFGPSKAAAQLEGSKSFTKDFLAKYNIPTADYAVFTEIQPALDYLHVKGAPIVIKADGLAAGKGVIVAMTIAEAEDAVKDMLSDNKFGEAGSRVVIEEFLDGEEASFIVMADGSNTLPFATSQDHKRAYDGDKGPNTGGMGAYSPAPVVTPKIHARIMNEVIEPTVAGMRAEGHAYTGFLYAGLMIMADGTPKVIEYNCRFGDPETQPIMLRLKSDLVPLIQSALDSTLNTAEIEFDSRASVGVVLAAGGYPGSYDKNIPIESLPQSTGVDSKIFHAGTKLKDKQVLTNGGRVLCATALGNSVKEAAESAYKLVDQTSWSKMTFRTDIAYRAIKRESAE